LPYEKVLHINFGIALPELVITVAEKAYNDKGIKYTSIRAGRFTIHQHPNIRSNFRPDALYLTQEFGSSGLVPLAN
jgi:hypothetical protein